MRVLVASEQQIGHEMHHITRREMLARVLVQRLVEAPDQFLEDHPHGRVVDRVRVQIDVLKALQHLEQQPGLVELGDGIIEIEFFYHLPHIGAEAVDIVAQVGGEVRRVAQQPLEVVQRGVVERKA